MPTFIIAEAGVNHNGSLEQAIRLVDVAAGDQPMTQPFDSTIKVIAGEARA